MQCHSVRRPAPLHARHPHSHARPGTTRTEAHSDAATGQFRGFLPFAGNTSAGLRVECKRFCQCCLRRATAAAHTNRSGHNSSGGAGAISTTGESDPGHVVGHLSMIVYADRRRWWRLRRRCARHTLITRHFQACSSSHLSRNNKPLLSRGVFSLFAASLHRVAEGLSSPSYARCHWQLCLR